MILLPVGCAFLTTQVQLSQRMDRRLHRWQRYMNWIRAASGGFWPSCGGSAGWTQKDLAERLYVSDKAVSKWERGVSHS